MVTFYMGQHLYELKFIWSKFNFFFWQPSTVVKLSDSMYIGAKSFLSRFGSNFQYISVRAEAVGAGAWL
jgi:hypothetical protein